MTPDFVHSDTQAAVALILAGESSDDLEAETADIADWLVPDNGDADAAIGDDGTAPPRPESRASVATNIPAVGKIELTLDELCTYAELHPSLWKAQINASECYNEDAGAVVHRFLVFELCRPTKKDVCLRLDRRRGADVSLLQFFVGSGITQANDAAQLASNKERILGQGRLENRQEFTTSNAPPTLGELRRLLMVIVEELSTYKIWPENCWFFCSVIQQHLKDNHRGMFVSGELFRPTLGREMRGRIMRRVQCGIPSAEERRETTLISHKDQATKASKLVILIFLQRRGAKTLNKLHKLSVEVPAATPWYLQPAYTDKELLFTPDRDVHGGTLSALVERLTYHDGVDTAFNEAFLVTFESFTTSAELIDHLTARFEKQSPGGLCPEETAAWKRDWQEPVRGRTIAIMRQLLLDDECSIREDRSALEKMQTFLSRHELTYPNVKTVAGLLMMLMSAGTAPMRTIYKIVPPPPILPKQEPSKKLRFLNMDPNEVARQLTIKESELFCKIRASECLARAVGEQTDNDNIKAVIMMSNKTADWVSEAVLAGKDARKRSLLIKHFILITDKCRLMNNFSTMAALVAALNSPPIRRLRRSWDQINSRYISLLDDIEKLMQAGKSLPEYRVMLSTVTLPCIPFIGVYLMTLTFLKDRMRDIISQEGAVINFTKRAKTAAIIKEIKQYQSLPHSFVSVEVVREFLEDALEANRPQDFYWELSLEREPAERDDERMARLLQDSGFL